MSRHKREQSTTQTTRDVSRLCRALTNKYRRAVVRALDETHTPVSRDALTTYVAKDLFPNRTGDDFIKFRDRLLVKLHHLHLPMLAKADIINIEANQITAGAMFIKAVSFVEIPP